MHIAPFLKYRPSLIHCLIAIALIAIVAAIATPPSYMIGSRRSPNAGVKADLRSLATAIESYHIDNNSYPAWTADSDRGVNAHSRTWKELKPPVPTLSSSSAAYNIKTLTTPLAYISSYFVDPFAAKGQQVTFGYYSINTVAESDPDGWILWSAGPDKDYDITMSNIEAVYNLGSPVPNPLLVDITYDPTNGTKSNGDVYRIHLGAQYEARNAQTGLCSCVILYRRYRTHVANGGKLTPI